MKTHSEDAFPRTMRVIREGITAGLHSGVQIYASHFGIPVADFAVGENTPEQPLTIKTRMLWLSAGKPVTAVAALQAIERGELQLDQPIQEILPEFSGPGTEEITLRRVLTHTAGLKPIVLGFPAQNWSEIISKICAAGLKRDQTPGAEVGYDPGRTWFLLGEMLQRVTGRLISAIVREDILEPIGATSTWMAMPPEVYDAEQELVGMTYTAKDGHFTPTRGHSREMATYAAPGSNMRGPIRELGKFYEMLLHKGKTPAGKQILQTSSVVEMTSRQRVGTLDVSFNRIVDFGLGVIINSAGYGSGPVPYGFGAHASSETFGHGGSQCSIGFADPEKQLVVAAIANGMPGDEAHNNRFHELNSAIYEDLGLT